MSSTTGSPTLRVYSTTREEKSGMPEITKESWAKGLDWGAAFSSVIAASLPSNLYGMSEDAAKTTAEKVVNAPSFRDAAMNLLQENLSSSSRSSELKSTSFELNEKFLAGTSNFQMTFGDRSSFMGGLDDFIGRPKDPDVFTNMQREHCSSSDSHVEFTSSNYGVTTTAAEEWKFVVDRDATPLAAGTLDSNGAPQQRLPVHIDILMQHENAIKAGLTKAEVVAARLYTGPMFMFYNKVLRDPASNQGNFLYTIHVLASCIIKLSAIHEIHELYRGVKGGALPRNFFIADRYGACGGTEFGFMSATTNKAVATKYAATDSSSDKGSVVFKIQEGSIDRGADLSWLSQYPNEDEVVFAPLTNLQVVGTPKVDKGCIVMTLRPNVNLRLKTVEEVLNRSKTHYMDMISWFYQDVVTHVFQFDINTVWPEWLDEFCKYKDQMAEVEGVIYNQQQFYRRAIDKALDLKEGTIKKALVLYTLSHLPPACTHDGATFLDTLSHIKESSAVKFAHESHILKFVQVDENGMSNYPILWSLPLEDGSWTRLVQGNAGRPCLKVVCPDISCVSKLQKKIVGVGILKRLMNALFGEHVVDSILGFEGNYFYMGHGQDSGTPYYQLIRKNGVIAAKYVYKSNRRWHIGSSLGSDAADLRTTETDAETPDLCTSAEWERSISKGIWGRLFPSRTYTHANSVNVVRDVVEQTTVATEHAIRVSSLGEHLLDVSEVKVNETEAQCSMRQFLFETTYGLYNQQNQQPRHNECYALVNRMSFENQKHTIGHISGIEIRSIELYCDQIGCKVPEELQKRLTEEQVKGENIASVWFTLMALCITVGATLGAVMLIVGAFAKFSWSTNLIWYSRGFWSAGLLAGFIVAFGVIMIFARTCGGKMVGTLAIIFLLAVCCVAFLSGETEWARGEVAKWTSSLMGGGIIAGFSFLGVLLAG
jgi:hypothetical protein